MKYPIALAFFLCFSISYGQSLNTHWEQALSGDLEQFNACDHSVVNDINTCNMFIGKSLNTVYKINDFYSKSQGRYMLVGEIESVLEDSKRWTMLGYGYEQQVLSKAQALANHRKAVIAIYINENDLGHLALVLPGELQPSGSWGFQVPNSSAFFMNDPGKSYINKGLSYSFPRSVIKHVRLYARNY